MPHVFIEGFLLKYRDYLRGDPHFDRGYIRSGCYVR